MFTKATPVQKKLKILLYGGSGTGKTLAALSFPRPAVVDAENGTDLYAGRTGVPSFSVLRIKTFAELEKAIAYIQADKGKQFDTLVIDSISVFYDVQKEAASKTSKDNELGYREWAKINNRMVYLYNALTNLPVHVVVIAREAIEYETKSGNLTKVGTKPDADKRLVYMFDFIIRMKDDHSGEVVKSRGASQLKNMPQVNWQAFAKIADMFTDGQTVPAIDEDAAAQLDSAAFVDAATAPAKPKTEAHWSTDSTAMTKMYEWALREHSATQSDVNKIIADTRKTLLDIDKSELMDAIKKWGKKKRELMQGIDSLPFKNGASY